MKESKNARRVLILLIVALIFVGAFFIAKGLLGEKEPQPAYDVSGVNYEGKITSLSDHFNHQGTVLLFFDLQTPKAVELLEQVNKIAPNYDVAVMATLHGDDMEKKKQELEKLKIDPSIIIFDTDGEMAKTYNISATPITYFIDKNGNIVDAFVASISDETLKEAFESID